MPVMKGVPRCLRMPKAGGANRPYSAEMALSHPLNQPPGTCRGGPEGAAIELRSDGLAGRRFTSAGQGCVYTLVGLSAFSTAL